MLRLDGHKYHGGNEFGPDYCDFRFYSELQRVKSLPEMLGILRTRPDNCKF